MDEVTRYRQPDSPHSREDLERHTGCKTVLEARDVRRSFCQWRVRKGRDRRVAYRSDATPSMFW